jgi:cell shape-determining protein MreC
MTNYHLRTTKQNFFTSYKKFFVAGIVLLGLFFLGSSVQSFFGGLASRLTLPVFALAGGLKEKTSFLFNFLEPKRKIIEENENLRKEVEYLRVLALGAGDRTSFNGIEESLKEKYIFARVLRSPDASPYDTLIIDMGEENQVNVGKKVFLENTVPIGEISYVYKKTAVAKLYSTPGESLVVVVGKKMIRGDAVGRGGGNFEIIFPHGVEVSVGDTVTFPEISDKPFSTIGDVSETEGGTFIRALFQAPISFSTVSTLMIER